jgi:hypothetical protein
VVSRNPTAFRWHWDESGLIEFESEIEAPGNEYLLTVIESMSRSHNSVTLFAFGLRKWMDVSCSWEWIDSGRLSLAGGTCITGNPPNIISATIKLTGSKLKMIDLLNYGIDKDVENESHFANPYHIFQWCQWYRQQLVKYNMGSWKSTGSGQAWETWRRNCLSHKIQIHADEEALKLERAAYYGGRCEPKFIGTTQKDSLRIDAKIGSINIDGPVFHLDVVGSYLGTARNLDVPVALIGKINGLENVREACETRNYGCLAAIHVSCPQPVYPYRWPNRIGAGRWWDRGGETRGMPRHPTESLAMGSIIYPIGEYATTLAGPELSHAISSGHVVAVHSAYLYSVAPALTSWVDYAMQPYIAAKKSGNPICKHVWKSIALSLFGRLARLSHVWHDLPDYDDAPRWKLWYHLDMPSEKLFTRRSLAGAVSEYRGPEEHDDSFPAIAAWINSAARIKLWTYIETARHGNVYYYDTDSIWCNSEGFRNLKEAGYIKDSELGFLSFRGEHNWLTIRGIKDYEVPGKVVKAGAAEATHINRNGIKEKIVAMPIESEISTGNAPRQVVVCEPIPRDKKYKHCQVLETGECVPWTITE